MKIRIALVAAALALATVGTADAQTRVNPDRSADQLNARVLEVLQARQTTPVVAAPVAVAPTPAPSAGMNLTGIYAGVNAGSNFRDGSDYQLGGVLGYQFHRNLAAELT